MSSSKYVIIDKIENNGKFLEFVNLADLYSVFIYEFYPDDPFFMPNQRRILKDTGILYDFGKAYTIFKKWKINFSI